VQPSALTLRRPPKREKPQGFSKSKRLLTGKDFKQVFEQAKRLSNAYWTVYAWRHKTDTTQLGLAIAKKTVRRAHERNRLKRLARETFRHMQTELIGVHYVVMAGKAAQMADNAVLCEQLAALFRIPVTRKNRQQSAK